MSFVQRKVAHCDRCGHEWITSLVPSHCAKCRSRKWNQEPATPIAGVSDVIEVLPAKVRPSIAPAAHQRPTHAPGCKCVMCMNPVQYPPNK
jgi:hypothetical protein